jgi:hypothetical protein
MRTTQKHHVLAQELWGSENCGRVFSVRGNQTEVAHVVRDTLVVAAGVAETTHVS